MSNNLPPGATDTAIKEAFPDNTGTPPLPPRRKTVRGCDTCDSMRERAVAPWHDASSNCESGGRDHCTCDTCF